MKLFHKENEKESVYVQMQDMSYLMTEGEIPIPSTIVTKVYGKGVVIVNDANRFDFVKFDEEHEVKFFKELDFIIDYEEYKDMTEEQLDEEVNKIAGRLNEIVNKWNSMTKKERKKNQKLYQEHKNILYKFNFLEEVYAVKHGIRTMPFPDFVGKES